MAGLAILKHTYDLSDEALCDRCGEEFFQHALVFDRSSLTRWRQRMGEDKLKALLQESLGVATRTEAMEPSDLAPVDPDAKETFTVEAPTTSSSTLSVMVKLPLPGSGLSEGVLKPSSAPTPLLKITTGWLAVTGPLERDVVPGDVAPGYCRANWFETATASVRIQPPQTTCALCQIFRRFSAAVATSREGHQLPL
jgi:hypothetical protein